MSKQKKIQFQVTKTKEGNSLPLPNFLQESTRSGSSSIDPLLKDIVTKKVYQLGSTSRSGSKGSPKDIDISKNELLAIEADDGTTIFIRSDRLSEDIKRIRPEAIINGEIIFENFRDPNEASRGLGDIFWKAVTILKLPNDGLVDEAKDLALDWAKDAIADKIYDTNSFLGAKALMWKIESHIAGKTGLYEWKDRNITSTNLCKKNDSCFKKATLGEPMLLLIHGTASYTQGGFDDLRKDEDTWNAFKQQFSGGIFGYEHRTFSQSPIENALELVEALPNNAKISLLTHSRGGLVGDLLCLGRNIKDSTIDSYKINTKTSDAIGDTEGLEQEEREERQRLRDLLKKLKDKNIVVERYVRVACPARGTRLLSDNLDVALSDFTNLLQTVGGTLVGTVAGAIGGPAAAITLSGGASSALGVLKRLILEIAGRRIDPRMIPGIAAMTVDSPLAAFLAHPDIRRHDATEIAVIAGDTEFSSLGFSNFRRRIANLFCDWRLFDQQDNDLVVDTDSMYAGLGFGSGVRYLFDKASSVTHFRYFSNPTTRDALCEWFIKKELADISQFRPISSTNKIPWKERDARAKQRSGANKPRPVAIIIPGIMGSHIEVDRKDKNKSGSGNRIWFDIPSLLIGHLEQIKDPTSKTVHTEDIFEKFYGDLADYLQESHVVIRSPYDWRTSLKECAEELLKKVEVALEKYPDQPIRLLAHSMGGLVARTLIKEHSEVWEKIINSGGRLVMLGTPNNGSHMMVHTLLGKNKSMRMLAKLDLKHDLQEVLDIVKNYPGALSLLPRPDFLDTGNQSSINTDNYYKADYWNNLKNKNRDFWYGDKIAGVAKQKTLDTINQFWNETLAENTISNPEYINYVFGQGSKTACGVKIKNNRLQLLFTADGDGTVTWKSGELDNLKKEYCWYMPVQHGDLTGVPKYFPAIVDLLEKGTTGKLDKLPRARGIEGETFVLEAPPPVIPSEDELLRAIMDSSSRSLQPMSTKKVLKVSTRAGDLGYCTSPVLCGHYYGDVISGAESALNNIVDDQLYQRQRLDVYADAIGTSTIVLMPSNQEEQRRNTQRGAIIVGLGEMNGRLSSTQVTESVRAGLLHLLLRTQENYCEDNSGGMKISSVLIGQNSTAHISIGESIAAVVRGVCEANNKFNNDNQFISEVEFIELYRDVAITAAHEIRNLPERMKGDLERLGIQLETEQELKTGKGYRDRLWAANTGGYWPRLIVTDADRNDELCPPECYQTHKISPINQEFLDSLLDDYVCECGKSISVDKSKDLSPQRHYPDRLRYVFVSEKARSESTALQRQPGLIEAIVEKQLSQQRYNQQLSRTLFELMIPLDYKSTVRELSSLVLQVDGYTANLPWELLQADNSEPMILKTALVRQLTTQRFRRNVRTAPGKTACIIVNPSTEDYFNYFSSSSSPSSENKLPELNGAVEEGEIVASKLMDSGYLDENISYSPSGAESIDVLHKLLSRPYRILVIAGHGVFEVPHKDGKLRTGVVLSAGSLITAAEIGQMEVVPELVFLNCCHIGTVSKDASFNKLAYSISRELIEMGVRCIVAAGWAVDDKAACTFSEKFFDEILTKKECFGKAVHNARKETYNNHRGTNTWGAYQAYGDPGYRLEHDNNQRRSSSGKMSAVAELLQELNNIQLKGERPGSQKQNLKSVKKDLSTLRERVPAEWLEFPEVLEAIGKVYRNLGPEGFNLASDYYLRAISLEDKNGVVAITTIEQLANMEARAGEIYGDEALIQSAIDRLEALHEISKSTNKNISNNPERAALLGSSYKRLASYWVKNTRKQWKTIKGTLVKCVSAYKKGALPEPTGSPYNTLNYLQFQFLTEKLSVEQTKNKILLAKECANTARQNYEKDGGFWNASIAADAEATAWILGASLPKIKINGKKKRNDYESLKKIYKDSFEGIPASNRHMDSVVTNLCVAAQFLYKRSSSDDPSKNKNDLSYAKILCKLANEFDNTPNCKCPNTRNKKTTN